MIDPFFQYIAANRKTVSNELYGRDVDEKEYSRSDYEELPPVVPPTQSFSELLLLRRSALEFSDTPLTLEQLSAFLRFSIARDPQSQGHKNYPFPSGGGFYPNETYLYLHNVEDKTRGLYHYSSRRHAVALVKPLSISLSEVNEVFGCQFESLPQAIVLMTMVKSRTIYKYGAFSHVLALIEAGHRGQNMCLSAVAHGLSTCPMGGGDYKRINTLLSVEGSNEHHIYGMAVGLSQVDR